MIGQTTTFERIPIRQVVVTSATMAGLNERLVIGNLLEGSLFSITPITRPLETGGVWTLGYRCEILARTAERPNRYFRAGLTIGGGVQLPQFILAAGSETLTLTMTFGNGFTNYITPAYTEIPMPSGVGTQSFQLSNVTVNTSVQSGQDGFMFGEIRINGFLANYEAAFQLA